MVPIMVTSGVVLLWRTALAPDTILTLKASRVDKAEVFTWPSDRVHVPGLVEEA